MQSLKKIISWVFGAHRRLSELEKLILNCVRGRLDTQTAILWDKQLSAINKFQRSPKGSEVNFYRMRNGKPSFDAELAFANKTLELRVADVVVAHVNVTPKLRAFVWSVNGFLFSIEYDGCVDVFEDAADEDTRGELKIDCELNSNLAEQVTS